MVTQDMPPPGGFGTINVERVPSKPWIRQGVWFFILAAATFNGFFLTKEFKKKRAVLKFEQTEHYIAASPFLIAEQERKYLRHLRVMRDEEREIMKDVPGWKVGTLYGEPIFKTLPKNALPPLKGSDYGVFRPHREFLNHVVIPDNHQ